MNVQTMRRELHALGSPEIAAHSKRFFKAIPGGYGEGDMFLGVRVPEIRRLARKGRDMGPASLKLLIRSRWHEERLLALVIMVEHFKRGDPQTKQQLHDCYLAHRQHVNNWDLVDISAPTVVGDWLRKRDRSLLYDLAASASLWEQRIAIMATFSFIRCGEFADTLAIAAELIAHEHDLIHKAVGWMLREVGNRDRTVAETFLAPRCRTMPRTMLRYAIEKYPEKLRLAYLKGTI